MKRIFSVIMALMLIISTTSQAYVVTVHGENCTYTLSSKANRGITLSDKRDNVRWWKVVDTYKNIIGVINSRFIMPEGNVEVTPMLTGNQIVVQQTTNGEIKYNGIKVNTIETSEGEEYTVAIVPNEGYEIEKVSVNGETKEVTNKTEMNYTFTNVNENYVITATYVEVTEPISYTITYNLDGGTNNENSPASYTMETESFTLSEPTKDGYIFIGWTGSNGTVMEKDVTIAKGSTGNRSYTANWKVWAGWNEPVLTSGLTPVNWNGSYWVATTKENWVYNYEIASNEDGSEKEGVSSGEIAAWANAMTADGSMYVWIPRYTYKITSGYHSFGNSWNVDDESLRGSNKIEIKFSQGTTDDTTEGVTNASEGYISHTAFTFGADELKGIWVAKFEASQGTTTDEVSVPTSSTSVAKSIPGVSSWRDLSVSNMFDYAYNTYRDADSHLMKNVEWGAVAYLTNAIGRIPYINNSSSFITGNAGEIQNAVEGSDTVSTYTWNTVNGIKASTTHNVYGIYDMSGGAWEYVAAYYTGGDSKYLAKDVSNKLYAGVLYTFGNDTSTAKYVDTYSSVYVEDKKGDAVYETSGSSSSGWGWDSDYSVFPRSYSPVFLHGGRTADVSNAGVFSFYSEKGVNSPNNGFRLVLAIK